jgi:hypothetical protein
LAIVNLNGNPGIRNFQLAAFERQMTPFVPEAVDIEKAKLLRNSGLRAAVINKLAGARNSLGDSLACEKRNSQI